MKPLAITGGSVVSALGVGRSAFAAALRDPHASERAFARRSSLTEIDEAFGKCRIAEVWDWNAKTHLGAKGHRTFDRLTKFLIAAAKYGLEDAGIKHEGEFDGVLGSDDIGVCSATAYGSLDAITELNRVAELEDPRYINPQRFPNTVINAAAGYVSIWETLRAPNTTVVNGNCGALDAVLVAANHLQHQRAKALLVGGGEVVSEPLLAALRRLGLVGDEGEGCDALAVGEGAAYCIVESHEGASARGAKVLAEIAGYGTSFVPPPSEALLVHPSGRAMQNAIAGALQDAELDAASVDLVIGSASGLAPFDEAERGALDHLRIAAIQTSLKHVIGESFGAAGALSMMAALVALEDGRCPAALGISDAPVRNVLLTTFGYYGNASAVILRAAPDLSKG